MVRVTRMSWSPSLLRPPVLQPGDKVAILSPSWAGPGVFPHVQDLGLRRLREHLELEPVEYPTTRKIGATPPRARRRCRRCFRGPSDLSDHGEYRRR